MIFTRGSVTTEGPHEHAMSLKISSTNAKPYKGMPFTNLQ